MSLKWRPNMDLIDLRRYVQTIPVVFVKNSDGMMHGMNTDCLIKVDGRDRVLMEEILSNLPKILELALNTSEVELQLAKTTDKAEELQEKLEYLMSEMGSQER